MSVLPDVVFLSLWIRSALSTQSPELANDNRNDEEDQHGDDRNGDYPIRSHPNGRGASGQYYLIIMFRIGTKGEGGTCVPCPLVS